MSDKLKVVEFRKHTLLDIPACLRDLADRVENGEYNEAHNLVWAIDEGDGVITVGMMGESKSPGAEAHLLLAMAQRRIERL